MEYAEFANLSFELLYRLGASPVTSKAFLELLGNKYPEFFSLRLMENLSLTAEDIYEGLKKKKKKKKKKSQDSNQYDNSFLLPSPFFNPATRRINVGSFFFFFFFFFLK